MGGLLIGEYGTGVLNVVGGANVSLSSTQYGGITLSNVTGSNGTLIIDGAGSEVSTPSNANVIVGGGGPGLLKITNGGLLSSPNAAARLAPGVGTVIVDGSGSTWNIGPLELGAQYYGGSGTMRITNGGVVNSSMGEVYDTNHVASIDGPGSQWNINTTNGWGGGSNIGGLSLDASGLYVSGGAALNVQDTTAPAIGIASGATLEVDVGRGSSVVAGTTFSPQTLTNNGTIRIVAPASATTGTAYSPVTASNVTSLGTVQAVGGTWSSVAGQFTPSVAVSGTSASATTISDLSVNQRMLITDSASGTQLGASFLAAAASDGTTVTLTASTLSQASVPGPQL